MNAITRTDFIENYRRIRKETLFRKPAPQTVVKVKYLHADDANMHVVAWKARNEAIAEMAAHARPKWREIAAEVEAKHGVQFADIVARSRFRVVVRARSELAYRMRVELGLSLGEIGRRLGDRDHSTVVSIIQLYAKRNGLPVSPPDGLMKFCRLPPISVPDGFVPRSRTPDRDLKILQAVSRGASQVRLAKAMGISPNVALGVVRRFREGLLDPRP